jgi:dihydrofolate reductase
MFKVKPFTCSQIVATDLYGVMSKQGIIPWHSKKDFEWFRLHTVGKVCLVGNKTFKTLPFLKNKIVIPVSKTNKYGNSTPSDWIKTALKIQEEELSIINQEIMIIGGNEIYNFFEPFTNRVYLTTIKDYVNCSNESLKDGSELYYNTFCFDKQWKELYKSSVVDEEFVFVGDKHKPTNLVFRVYQKEKNNDGK